MSGTSILTRCNCNKISFYSLCQFSFNKLACSMPRNPKTCNKIVATFHCFSFCSIFQFRNWEMNKYFISERLKNRELQITSMGQKRKKENETEWFEDWNNFITRGVCVGYWIFLKNGKFQFTSIFHCWEFHSLFSTLHWW